MNNQNYKEKFFNNHHVKHHILNNISSTRFNESSNLNKNISRLNYEEIKQQYLEQEEEIEVLQAKVRRLEHVLQLKDTRINHLLNNLQNDQTIKSVRSTKK